MIDEERQRFIGSLANDEWVDDTPRDADFEQLSMEWAAKAEAFATTEQDPWQLLAFVGMYNWDKGLDLLRLILDNPACDRGTALTVFWAAQPTYYQNKVESDLTWQREDYEFVIELRDRLATDRYAEVITTFDTMWTEPDADGALWTIPDEWRDPSA